MISFVRSQVRADDVSQTPYFTLLPTFLLWSRFLCGTAALGGVPVFCFLCVPQPALSDLSLRKGSRMGVIFVKFRPFLVRFLRFYLRSSAQICGKSFFFNSAINQVCNFLPPPCPTPYVDPIPPKTTQCHPWLRGQAEGRVFCPRHPQPGVPDTRGFRVVGRNVTHG
jgi:hypothetical protein